MFIIGFISLFGPNFYYFKLCVQDHNQEIEKIQLGISYPMDPHYLNNKPVLFDHKRFSI